MTSARNLAAGGAKRGGKTAVPKLRAAAERVLACTMADLPVALDELRAALAAEKNASVGYAPEPFDWFVEEAWCVDLLFAAEQFEGEIVDPACGMGTIPARAKAAGYRTSAYDLIDRPRIAEFPFEAWSFFDERHPLGRCDNIVSNPPYSYQKGIAEQFIRYALTIARRKVAMLLPVKFNSSNGRHALFTETPLARIYTLSSRPSMPPGSMLVAGTIKPGGGKVDYAWYVWEAGHVGPPTNHYLIRPEKLAAQRRRSNRSTADPPEPPPQSAPKA